MGAARPRWLQEAVRRIERTRIRQRLRAVETRLRANRPATLSPEQRVRRAANLNRLHEYWTAGRFPANTIDAKHRTPIFVDAKGTPCAVAYLVERSGDADLVSAIARDSNLVLIPDVTDGPLLGWLEREGLTREEAARIQPTYSPELDLLILTTVLFAVFLPLKVLGEAMLRRFSRDRPNPTRAVHIGLTIALVVAAISIALGAAVVLQPTNERYAAIYRTALFLGFLATLLPLELAASWALRSWDPVSGARRHGASVYLGLLNVAAAVLLAWFVVPLFARLLG